MSDAPVWRTLLGDYAITHALRSGEVASPLVRLDFADVAVPNKAFKRVVRDLEFDVAELALMTFLMARSRQVPLRMLPIVVFSRNPLRYLVCRRDRGLQAGDLDRVRVGARAYTTTTAVWTRALLADQFGVDLASLRWLTYEEGHVAGVREPATVRRDALHGDLGRMVLDGTIDVAILDPVPDDPRLGLLIPDPDAAWHAWQTATGAQTVNHVVVIREPLLADTPRVRELLRLFAESAARYTATDALFPAARLERSLAQAIVAATEQGLLDRPLSVTACL